MYMKKVINILILIMLALVVSAQTNKEMALRKQNLINH